MKPVDILGRVDGGDHRLFVDMARQGKLHQYAIDTRIAVQLLDQFDQLFFADAGRAAEFEAFHPGLDRHLALVADIYGARRVFTHQHDREARLAAGGGDKIRNTLAHLHAQSRRECLAVDQFTDAHDVFNLASTRAIACPISLILSRFSRLVSPASSVICLAASSSIFAMTRIKAAFASPFSGTARTCT